MEHHCSAVVFSFRSVKTDSRRQAACFCKTERQSARASFPSHSPSQQPNTHLSTHVRLPTGVSPRRHLVVVVVVFRAFCYSQIEEAFYTRVSPTTLGL
jgi:hypothetical protein